MTKHISIIVFYDGLCVLCNRSIIWFIKNDSQNILKFSHFKSELVLKNHKHVSEIEAVSSKVNLSSIKFVNLITKSSIPCPVLAEIKSFLASPFES